MALPEPAYLEQWRTAADELRRILEPGFDESPVGESRFNPVQLINNIWRKTLSQGVGYDYTSKRLRLLAVDEFGRTIVSVGGVPTLIPSIGVVSVTAVATLVAQARDGRSYVILENVSATDIWIGKSNTVAVNAGLLLQTSKVIELRDWVDELWGITPAGTSNVGVVER